MALDLLDFVDGVVGAHTLVEQSVGDELRCYTLVAVPVAVCPHHAIAVSAVDDGRVWGDGAVGISPFHLDDVTSPIRRVGEWRCVPVAVGVTLPPGVAGSVGRDGDFAVRSVFDDCTDPLLARQADVVTDIVVCHVDDVVVSTRLAQVVPPGHDGAGRSPGDSENGQTDNGYCCCQRGSASDHSKLLKKRWVGA